MDSLTEAAHEALLYRRSAIEREAEEIDAALERIAAGRFGVCVHCGRAIGRQRLRAVPEARSCIACEEEGATP